MIALFDFIPLLCPSCGQKWDINHDKHTRADFNNGVSHSCDCGLGFAKVDTGNMRDAATKSGSDLEDYH